MGRDNIVTENGKIKPISTHTPAWGATQNRKSTALIEYISTHTPAWGATQLQSFSRCFETNFNSHARVGRDLSKQEAAMQLQISTHTPAWGATEESVSVLQEKVISTHTPAWGATLKSKK